MEKEICLKSFWKLGKQVENMKNEFWSQREMRERGFIDVCYCLVSKDILKHCLMESDVDLVEVWWRRFV